MPRVKKNNYEQYDSPFASRLRDLLNQPEMNQSKLADSIGVTRQAVSAYSLGISLPDIEKFGLIADFFGVSTEFLLGRTDVSEPDATKQVVAAYLGLSEAAIDEIKHLQAMHLEQNIENDFKLTIKGPEPLTEVFSNWLATADLSEMMSHVWRASRAAYEAQDSAYHPEGLPARRGRKRSPRSLARAGIYYLDTGRADVFFLPVSGEGV